MSDDVKQIIEDTTNMTIIKLKKAGFMRGNKKTTFKKTEQLLKSYNGFKDAIKMHDCDVEKTKKIVKMIDDSLKQINDEAGEYYGLLEMIYFERKTREELAYEFDCEPITITRNKNKMVNKLKILLFSDEVIEELFL